MIINATSIGLNTNDKINLNFKDVGTNKFFYDVIYNPKETNFLSEGKKLKNKTEKWKKKCSFIKHQRHLRSGMGFVQKLTIK